MLAVISFIIILLLLVLVHEYGHFKAARWLGVAVEEFGLGFPPAVWKKRFGATIYSINWLPLGGFVKIKGEEGENLDPDSYSSQGIVRRAAIVAAGIVMNLVLAAVLFTGGYVVGMPAEIGEEPPAGAIIKDLKHEIVGVIPDSPAAGVLQTGDTIQAINGQEFSTRSALQTYLRSQANQPLVIKYQRGAESTTTELTPQAFRADDREIVGLGVQIFSSGLISYPVYLAPYHGLKYTGQIFYQIAEYFGSMIFKLVNGIPQQVEVAGPVGIAVLSGEVARQGVIFFLQFVALLSINLAFVNLLPFPALDGGRLLFLAIEAVRGRPVSPAVEGRVHRWGFVILLLIVLLVTYSDIGRLAN
jgi:regulator of sigma E protease